MKRLWKGCLGLMLSLAAPAIGAQEMQWHPVAERPAVPALQDVGVQLTAPVPLPGEPRPLRVVQQASFQQSDVVPPRIVRGQVQDPLLGSPGAVPPPPPLPGPAQPGNAEEAFNCGQSVTSRSGGGSIFDQGKEAVAGIPGAVGGMFSGGGRSPLQSDHAFDSFCSPVTNPFLFQDPRSLTQIQPLLIYQHVPGKNYAFQGGDIWFYGVNGSVAITDMFSVVIDKLGFVTFHPHTNANGISNSTGFSELEIGPKFTFIRSEATKTLLAAGLNFDLAVGSAKVFQSTGDLSLIPYLSFGQGFGKSDYGSFNFLTTVGYSFATDNQRTDFFYSSYHLDFDVANLNKFFPLIELNWFHYTTNGHSPKTFGFEGRDLANFGSGGVAGHNDLSLALGMRYKFCEWFQVGLAAEFPLLSRKDLMDYRIGLDLIFRY